MGRSHPALARSLPDSFPDPCIINLYAQPAVTPITKLPILQSPAPPDIAPLASLVQQLLGWESKKVVSTFRSTIWPVVVLHEVLEDLANNSPASDEVCCCSPLHMNILTDVRYRLLLLRPVRGQCFRATLCAQRKPSQVFQGTIMMCPLMTSSGPRSSCSRIRLDALIVRIMHRDLTNLFEFGLLTKFTIPGCRQ